MLFLHAYLLHKHNSFFVVFLFEDQLSLGARLVFRDGRLDLTSCTKKKDDDMKYHNKLIYKICSKIH